MNTDTPIKLHAIGNAHIDPVWLWRWTEGLETIRATFRSALDILREHPDFVFTCSSSAFYELLEAVEPGMIEEIRQYVHEGRWELVGGWWVEPDTNLPSGESLVRQGLYGQRYLKETFGRVASVGYNPDTFGHPGTLPQILRSLRLTRYVFMRPGTHEKELPGHLFRWRGSDGSEVLTARIARSYATWGSDLREHVDQCEREAPRYVGDYLVFYGVGNHGGGPTRENLASIEALRLEGRAIEFSSLDRFFAAIECDERSVNLPVVQDELQHHARGCYSAHSGVKRHNRRAEALLMCAEGIGAIAASLVGYRYPHEDLTRAWKALLFTQFHDILAGTSLPEAYVDARDAHGFAAHIASNALHTGLQAMTAAIDTRGTGSALVLFNPLPWPVCMPIEIERGPAALVGDDGMPIAAQSIQPTTTSRQSRTCIVCSLPACGYRVLRHSDESIGSPSARPLNVDERHLSNEWWRLTLGDTGLPLSLTDRDSGIDYLREAGMSLVVLDDPSDTWSHGIRAYTAERGRFTMAGAPVVEENGTVRAAIRSELVYGASRALHRIRLYRDLPLIEGSIEICWNEPLSALKLSIPTPFRYGSLTSEIPYGHMIRAQDGEEHPYSGWLDISQPPDVQDRRGLTILSETSYGYDAQRGEIRLTLLRSPVYAHHDPAVLESDLQYRYMDQGWSVYRYRLIPHMGDWREARAPLRALEHAVPMLWVNEYAHAGMLPVSGSFSASDPWHVVMSAIKRSEEGNDLVVRCVETAGLACTATFELRAPAVSWSAEFAPNQIRTFRILAGAAPSVIETDCLEIRLED
ncbi:MAG: alpha-mannosidase [Chthonomonadales bacterium]|nr:alpha-mannosidase [Chthonomonadales bacterium]